MNNYVKPIFKTLAFIFLYLVVNTVILIGVLIATGVEDIDNISANTITITLLATQIIILGLILIMYNRDFLSQMRFERISPKIILWALIVGFAGINISVMLINLVNLAFPDIVASYIEAIESSIGGADLWLSILAVAIMAPIVEEIAFRGMFFRWFERTSIRPWALIVLSGVFFGLFHLNLVQGVFASAIGIIYALGFYWTKSIWVPIAMHFGNNVYAALAELIPVEILEATWFGWLNVAFIVFVPIGLWQIKKIVDANNSEIILS